MPWPDPPNPPGPIKTHPEPVNAALSIDELEDRIGGIMDDYKNGIVGRKEATRNIRVFCAEQVS